MSEQNAADERAPALPDAGTAEAGLQSVEWLTRLAAFHQAGHAVVAALLGARVQALEFWRGPPPGGRVHVTGLDEDTARSSDRGVVLLLAYTIAGPIAEHIAEGGRLTLQGDAGARAATAIMDGFRAPETIAADTDEGAAAQLLLGHFGASEEEAAAAVDHLAMSIEGWVWDWWDAIAVVAANLLHHGRLTTDEFRSIVPSMPPKALR